MNHFVAPPGLWALLLCGLLAGCGQAPADDAQTATPASAVAVTTVVPVRRSFHDSIEAWGSVNGDPRRARVLSLAHGGQVTALEVSAGQAVKRGQPLLTITPDPIARSAYQQAQTALTAADGELVRTRQLAAQRLATQSQLAAARRALADARSTLAAQRALGGAADAIVNAPADGVVTTLQVELGERVAANAPLLSFTPSHALLVVLGVQPEDGARLRTGMPVQVQPVHGAHQPLVGTLRTVSRAIDPQSRLLNVQVALPANTDANLMTGTAVSARIDIAMFTSWSVPRAAVLHDAHGDYLFQVERGHAKRINVTVRGVQGETLGVEGPLDPKAKIVVLGVYELDDGAALRESAG